MPFIIVDTLLAALDTAIELATLIRHFLETLKTLVDIVRQIYALFWSLLQQWQWQWSQIIKNQILDLNINSITLALLYLQVDLPYPPPDPHPVDLPPPKCLLPLLV